MVTSELSIPSAKTGPVPEILLLAATGIPPTKIAVPPDIATGVNNSRLFISALVDFNEQIETPRELEELQAP